MRIISFDTSQEIPIIGASIHGPLGFLKVKLVFDTGNGVTSIHTPLIEEIGYSARDGIRELKVRDPVGPSQPGYLVSIDCLSIFGLRFNNFPVGAYDFDNFDHYGIDGLLGFDVIKQLSLAMVGPEGSLSIYSAEDRGLLAHARELTMRGQQNVSEQDVQVLIDAVRMVACF